MIDQAEVYEIEPIPDEDSISRGCYLPNGIDPESIFPFPSNKITGERAESVYWRKYARTIESVHERGCKRADIINERHSKKEQVFLEYIGAITALVGTIRHIKTERGFSVAVNHLPEDGDRAHTHICVSEPTGADRVKFKSNDRRELVHMLCSNSFGTLEKHSYSCQQTNNKE